MKRRNVTSLWNRYCGEDKLFGEFYHRDVMEAWEGVKESKVIKKLTRHDDMGWGRRSLYRLAAFTSNVAVTMMKNAGGGLACESIAQDALRAVVLPSQADLTTKMDLILSDSKIKNELQHWMHELLISEVHAIPEGYVSVALYTAVTASLVQLLCPFLSVRLILNIVLFDRFKDLSMEDRNRHDNKSSIREIISISMLRYAITEVCVLWTCSGDLVRASAGKVLDMLSQLRDPVSIETPFRVMEYEGLRSSASSTRRPPEVKAPTEGPPYCPRPHHTLPVITLNYSSYRCHTRACHKWCAKPTQTGSTPSIVKKLDPTKVFISEKYSIKHETTLPPALPPRRCFVRKVHVRARG
eukprot:TRINITY_DN967_c7_g1_i1.p1 TRINITY_DN967_c7_g1~~TRINITY_DN967_c7_g1_i1.p1  ORF type:complete len:354 (+),score=49.70 TRINITY_DN967_c7_g1_i1:121-1182(+)